MKKFLFSIRFFRYLSLTGFVFFHLFFTLSAGTAGEDDKFHICFFELDNTVTGDNFEKQNKNSNRVVHRYKINKGESGKGAVKRMIESGRKCDGLVFSGHHTGDWFGDTGVVQLKDLEEFSCNPKYRNWFENIKMLWLDGCNTATDNFIQSKGIIKTPDSEAVRLLGKGLKDKTKLNKDYIGYFQQTYSAVLDENTPFSSYYLRMFPNTEIYAFNDTAPSGKQLYGRSYQADHLAKLGEAILAEIAANKTNEQVAVAVAALSEEDCDTLNIWEQMNDQTRVEAIKNKDYKKAHKLGCDLILAKRVLDDPTSTEAQSALAEQIVNDPKYINNREILELANKILNETDPKDKNNSEFKDKAVKLAKQLVVDTLKAINEADLSPGGGNKKYFHLLFNNLYETWNTAKKYKNKDVNFVCPKASADENQTDFFCQVKSQFQAPGFTSSIEERIESPYTASLKKGSYIKFYTDIHDVDLNSESDKAKFVKERVRELFKKAQAVFPDLKSPRKLNLDLDTKRALAVSIADQLLQYNLLNKDQINKLKANKKLFPTGTKNPFLVHVQTSLDFKGKSSDVIVDSVKGQTAHSLRKRSGIRTGAAIFFRNGDKQSLAKLANAVSLGELVESTDSYAFVKTLHDHLADKTDEDKIDILFNLSRNTKQNLEMLILSYANCNLSDNKSKQDLLKQKLFDKITDETHNYKVLLTISCPTK